MTARADRLLRARLNAPRDPVLVTRRLALTLPNPARVPELVQLLRDPRIARWTLNIPYPYRASDARTWLRRAPARRRAGTDLILHLVRRSDRALVGGLGLHHFDARHARAEVGYWLGKPFRRQGYTTEAIRALCEYAFRRLGLHRLEAKVLSGNAASVGVLRAAGFRREGRLRQSVVKQGRFRDEIVFSRLAGDRPRTGRTRRGRPLSGSATARASAARARRPRAPRRKATPSKRSP